MNLYVVRHGETIWNVEKKVQGITPTVRTLNTSAYCACMKCCGKTNGITETVLH